MWSDYCCTCKHIQWLKPGGSWREASEGGNRIHSTSLFSCRIRPKGLLNVFKRKALEMKHNRLCTCGHIVTSQGSNARKLMKCNWNSAASSVSVEWNISHSPCNGGKKRELIGSSLANVGKCAAVFNFHGVHSIFRAISPIKSIQRMTNEMATFHFGFALPSLPQRQWPGGLALPLCFLSSHRNREHLSNLRPRSHYSLLFYLPILAVVNR